MPDLSKLTPKQRQVYDLILSGVKPPAVAKKLKITTSGVYGHLRKMRDVGIDPMVEIASLATAIADADAQQPVEPPAVEVAESNGRVATAEEFLATAIADAEAQQTEVAQYIEQHRSEIEHAEQESERLTERVGKLHASLEALA